MKKLFASLFCICLFLVAISCTGKPDDRQTKSYADSSDTALSSSPISSVSTHSESSVVSDSIEITESLTGSPVTEPITTTSNTLTTTPQTMPANTTSSAATSTEVTEPIIPADDELVAISQYLPSAILDIRYATVNNFTGQIIYEEDFVPCMRYGTLKKLIAVASELEESGLYLKIWDAYRPTSAQFRLWEICPDGNYVSNPYKGFSSHSRGNTVDLTLVDKNGNELTMPSGFDEFSSLADRDYSDVPKEAADNASLLEDIMKKHGFKGYAKEWWHYTDTNSYPVVEG